MTIIISHGIREDEMKTHHFASTAIAFVFALCCGNASAGFLNYANVVTVVGECTDGFTQTTASCSIHPGSGPSQSGTAYASGDAFGLHAYASVLTTVEGGNAVSAIGTAQLGDFWTFGGTLPSLVNASINITADGTEATTLGAASAQTLLSLTQGQNVLGQCSFADVGNCTVNGAFDPALGLSLAMRIDVQALCDVVLGDSGSCSSVSDYLDTAFISAVSFTDANGNPLNLSFTSAAGLTYPMAQPPSVSEPAPVALIGLGFAALTLARRRRTY